MSARIINLHTGLVTEMGIAWHEDFEPETCRYCNTHIPNDADDGDWTCDDCTERMAMNDWLDRSAEAQDRAVLQGYG